MPRVHYWHFVFVLKYQSLFLSTPLKVQRKNLTQDKIIKMVQWSAGPSWFNKLRGDNMSESANCHGANIYISLVTIKCWRRKSRSRREWYNLPPIMISVFWYLMHLKQQSCLDAKMCCLKPAKKYMKTRLVGVKGPQGAESFQYHYQLSHLSSNKSCSNAFWAGVLILLHYLLFSETLFRYNRELSMGKQGKEHHQSTKIMFSTLVRKEQPIKRENDSE